MRGSLINKDTRQGNKNNPVSFLEKELICRGYLIREGLFKGIGEMKVDESVRYKSSKQDYSDPHCDNIQDSI